MLTGASHWHSASPGNKAAPIARRNADRGIATPPNNTSMKVYHPPCSLSGVITHLGTFEPEWIASWQDATSKKLDHFPSESVDHLRRNPYRCPTNGGRGFNSLCVFHGIGRYTGRSSDLSLS